MKANLLLVFALLLTGCVRDGASPTPTDNPNFPLAKLFTVNDCTMYRFYDDGYRWFMTCPGYTEYTRGCGKGCSTNEVIETVPVEAP